MSVSDLADPRAWPVAAAGDAGIYAAADDAISAATRREADVFDAKARRSLETALAAPDGNALARTLANAPSPAVARHLRRLLGAIEHGAPAQATTLRTTLFAIPVILVAALDAGASPVTLAGVLPDANALAGILREARALGGCEAFTLSASLVAVHVLDVAALPALLTRQRLPAGVESAWGSLDLPPAPIDVDSSVERVHLRFIPGAVLTPPRIDPFASPTVSRWGIALAQAIVKALAAPGVSLLALPRPAQRLVGAVLTGRAAQREVSAQVFASNAIRKFRASYGEPTAIVSAHRTPDAPGGGELRLSLSSPFAPRAAEGFRCPIHPYETVQEVASMLETLLRDCHVADVRFVPGVQADIDPATGGPRFFKNNGASAEDLRH